MIVKSRKSKAADDLGLHCINPWEAAYLGREVALYLSHGIRLEPGATVVDAGANIGVFSAYVHGLLDGDVRIFASEPLPPIYTMLERNARERLGGRVTALPYGFSSKEEEVEFTYFPLATILSSAYRNDRNVAEEQERIAGAVVDLVKAGHAGPLLGRIPSFVVRRVIERRLRGMRQMHTHRVRVRPLSDVIDEQGIDRIDLLKVDVEGAEIDVLAGIDERHWPRVRQAVVEVEGWRARHAAVREVFACRGFEVHAEQGPVQESADIGMIYAIAS